MDHQFFYASAFKWAEKNGITGGIGGGLFGSNNNCTCGQIVTFLYRTYQASKGGAEKTEFFDKLTDI